MKHVTAAFVFLILMFHVYADCWFKNYIKSSLFKIILQLSSVQLLSRVWLFATPFLILPNLLSFYVNQFWNLFSE